MILEDLPIELPHMHNIEHHIDLLMTVWYNHEAWKGCVCWRRRMSPMVTYAKTTAF